MQLILRQGRCYGWSKVDDHPHATTTAQPVLYRDVIYQPVSSLEEAAAVDEAYTCCSFRGSVVALDAQSGEQIWKSYTIMEEPKKVGISSAGVPVFASPRVCRFGTLLL